MSFKWDRIPSTKPNTREPCGEVTYTVPEGRRVRLNTICGQFECWTGAVNRYVHIEFRRNGHLFYRYPATGTFLARNNANHSSYALGIGSPYNDGTGTIDRTGQLPDEFEFKAGTTITFKVAGIQPTDYWIMQWVWKETGIPGQGQNLGDGFNWDSVPFQPDPGIIDPSKFSGTNYWQHLPGPNRRGMLYGMFMRFTAISGSVSHLFHFECGGNFYAPSDVDNNVSHMTATASDYSIAPGLDYTMSGSSGAYRTNPLPEGLEVMPDELWFISILFALYYQPGDIIEISWLYKEIDMASGPPQYSGPSSSQNASKYLLKKWHEDRQKAVVDQSLFTAEELVWLEITSLDPVVSPDNDEEWMIDNQPIDPLKQTAGRRDVRKRPEAGG